MARRGEAPKREVVSAFGVIAPGLEPALLDELAALGVRGRVEEGGVAFDADLPALYRVHLHARTPARVWVRLGAFPATTLDALGAGARKLPWARYLHPRQPLAVRVTTHRSRLHHRESVASKVELAARDALRGPRRSDGARPPRETLDALVRITDDRAEISVDASGELLHRRGWRRDTSEAPLRENLAAACLWLAGWSPDQVLVDPMCGSGTFPIEAATIALGTPPGGGRPFAFERWPCHDAAAWAKVKGEPRDPPVAVTTFGSDRDADAVAAARANARRAGVEARVELAVRDVSDLQPPAPSGLVICNPPYGERIGGAPAAWEALGRVLRERFEGWRVALVVPDAGLLRRTRLSLERAATFSNGGLRVSLFVGDVRAQGRSRGGATSDPPETDA